MQLTLTRIYYYEVYVLYVVRPLSTRPNLEQMTLESLGFLCEYIHISMFLLLSLFVSCMSR
jgi:hypothetical protein